MPLALRPRLVRALACTVLSLQILAAAAQAATLPQHGYGQGRGNDDSSAPVPAIQPYELDAPFAIAPRVDRPARLVRGPDHVLNTFTVTTAADTGTSCLRAAITAANASPGLDLIRFDIQPGGVQTLSPTSQLPDITERVIIDGTTQSGYAGTPVIELSGASAGGNAIGLVVKGGLSTIRGLCVNRWATTGSGGFGIVLDVASGDSVLGCYLGTDPTGTIARPNAVNGLLINGTSTFNVIGGPAAGQRNVISGNTSSGIQIATGNGGFNTIAGNIIGLKANGTSILANGANGIFLNSSDNVIGGTVAGAGNVISGNAFPGVFIGLNAQRTLIQGNFIGTDITGLIDLGNVQNGINLDRSQNNMIGDSTGVWRNIIAGNDFPGVYLSGAATTGNFVEGNFICVGRDGLTALGDGNGIVLDAAISNRIGGNSKAKRNVIGGTPNVAISIINGATSNWIMGNYIGTDSTGLVAVPCLKGVLANNSPFNRIGGPTFGDGNLISGNTSFGVEIRSAGAARTFVENNWIGIGADETTALGNGSYGICTSASNDTIDADNEIAFNFGAGVYDSAGTGHVIRHNKMWRNVGLGIDIKPPGITPNDSLDTDAGVNDLSNFPALDSASVRPAKTMIRGHMQGKPNRRYLIDYYSSDSVDASHFGEGQRHELAVGVTTNAAGFVELRDSLGYSLAVTRYLTATATDSLSGTTSEFSQAIGLLDSDGDGLFDTWETQGWGIDIDNDGVVDLDLYALGARANHKDLFVELDAMLGHKPPPTSIPMVVTAFGNVPNACVNNPDGLKGVLLHAALDDSTIGEQNLPVMWANFATLKSSWFGTKTERESSRRYYLLKAKHLVYRYGMWVRTFCADADTGSSGLAENDDSSQGGDDFVISFGSSGACGWNNPTNPTSHAGTLMHEFGHTLGLQHGGGDGLNYKQNYYSVMNYLWQLPRPWQAPRARRLDYSPVALPLLVEQHLNENAGLGVPAGVWPITTVPYVDNAFVLRQARLEHGAKVDWSGDGNYQSDVEGDIDIVKFNTTDCLGVTDYTLSPRESMTGYADWPNLRYNFRNSVFYDSVQVYCPAPGPGWIATQSTPSGELKADENANLNLLPGPSPTGQFAMDGALDPSAQLLSTSGGISLYASYRAGQLYLAANAAPTVGADLVVFLSDSRGALHAAPLGKAGQAAAWTAYLGNRLADNGTDWADDTEAALSSVTADSSGTFMEGVVDVGLLFGTYPGDLYVALGKYVSGASGALVGQVPPGNGDGNLDGTELYHLVVPAGVPGTAPGRAPLLVLSAARPNPVLGSTSVQLTMPTAAFAEVAVLDVLGRRVATLANGPLPAGVHTLTWSPFESNGHRPPPGVYYVIARVLGETKTSRIVLLR